MTTAMAMPGNTASTFLTHFFGTGLADERYVVERFKAMAIRPWPGEASATRKGRRPKRITATLKAVREMRPAPTGSALACVSGAASSTGAPSPRACSATAGRRAERRSPRRPVGASPAGRSSPGFHPRQGEPMCEQDIEARRARDPERYHRRAAERCARGLCLKCGKRPPAPHRSQCEPCAGKRRPAERSAQGLCPKCGRCPPASDRTLCDSCGQKRNRASRARDAGLRAAGMPRRDPERARASARDRRQAAAGLCAHCGKAHPRARPGGRDYLPRWIISSGKEQFASRRSESFEQPPAGLGATGHSSQRVVPRPAQAHAVTAQPNRGPPFRPERESAQCSPCSAPC